jgi:hypothetical protein
MRKNFDGTLKSLVCQYMKTGKKLGFARAEFILMKFLPDNLKIDGKCFNVPESK